MESMNIALKIQLHRRTGETPRGVSSSTSSHGIWKIKTTIPVREFGISQYFEWSEYQIKKIKSTKNIEYVPKMLGILEAYSEPC